MAEDKNKIKILTLSVGVSIALGLWLVLTSKNPRIEDIEKMKSMAEQKEKSLKPPVPSPRFSNRSISSDLTVSKQNSSSADSSNHLNPQPVKPLTKQDLEMIEKIRSQAKGRLAVAYTSLVAFSAEWNRFSTDLVSTGMDFEKEIPFKMGFLQAYRPPINPDELAGGLKENPERMSTDSFIVPGKIKYVNGAKSIELSQFVSHCKWGCSADSERFEMIVAFRIPGYDRIEVWTIDSDKNITNVISGTDDLPTEKN